MRTVDKITRAVTQPPRTVPSNRTLGEGSKEMTKSEIEAMSFQQKLNKLRKGIVIPPPDRIQRNLDEEKVYEIASQYTSRGAFRDQEKTAYNWAQRRGRLDEFCEHMEPAKRGPKSCAE